VTNEPLTGVLDKCFAGQPLEYRIYEKSITVREKVPVTAPTRELRGKVVNEKGEPVAGITVAIKHTSFTSVSDSQGEFGFLTAPTTVILVISGAEMEIQEMMVGEAPFALVTVKTKVGVLDEAFVIAYGKATKRTSANSVSRLTKDEISKHPVSNPLLALSGRISGLQVSQISGAPGSQIIVQLRGRNSLANGNDPLYIIDGVPFPSVTLSNSIGGAATYTSPLDNINAADIESIEVLKDADATAIFGSRGANGVILITTKKAVQGKVAISVRADAGAGKITRRMDLLSTPAYLAMRREAFSNDGANPTNTNAPDLKLWDSTRYTDWQHVLIGHTVHQQDLNVGLSGGTGYTQFLLTAGYRKETTVFPGDFGREKISGMFTFNHRSGDQRFSLSFTGSYLVNESILPREDISRRITLAPNAPALYHPSGALNWENSTWVNPLSFAERPFTNKSQVFTSSLMMGYKIIPALELKITSGYTWQFLREHGINPKRSFNPTLNSVSSATFGRTELQTIITEPQVVFQRNYNLHSLEAVGGLTVLQTDQQNLQQTGTGYTSDALLNSIQAAASVSTTVEADTRYRYSGLFGRVSYHFDKKYLATLTVRRDGSSRYGAANRFASFYAAGLGWVFTQEKWLREKAVLSFGKLRISAGRSGNDQIGDYRHLDLYSPYSNSYQSVVPFYPTQLHNPYYGWEQVNKKELGLDLGILTNRVQLTANYYHNTTANQLIQYPLPATTGFDGILKNLPATIRNTGLELELHASIVRTVKRNWTVSFNFTLPSNKLVAFDDLPYSSYANVYVVGQPLSIVKRLGFDGVDPMTGAYTFIDYDKDGQVSPPQDEQKVINVAQRFFGGMQHTLTFGRLQLSFLMQFVRQPYAPNYLLRFSRPGSIGNQPVQVLQRWQKPGDQTSIQRFSVSNATANIGYSYYQFSNAGLSDASFIRLRNVYAEYDLLSPRLKKMGMKKLSVFIQGHNLITLTSYEGLDPETQTFLPPVKMVTAGIQLNF
ncbi:MAG TPA: SusC/RagA family TonB-linked outer membrane protein, partial [Chitinophagaceae bacterium]|nr:SusC/RagA family TonB-linked outer membrane protein [Chitinophagaceae bacterium]